MSPAIDILVSSNLERYLWECFGGNRTSELYQHLSRHKYFEITNDELTMIRTKATISYGWCTEQDCKETIDKYKNKNNYLLDPHAAVAVKVANDFQRRKNKSSPENQIMLIASTAHYSKFSSLSDTNLDFIVIPETHIGIEQCKAKNVVHTLKLEPDLNKIMLYLESFIATTFKEPK